MHPKISRSSASPGFHGGFSSAIQYDLIVGMDPVGRDLFDSRSCLSPCFLQFPGPNHNAEMIPNMCVKLVSDYFSTYPRMIACQYNRLFHAIHVSARIDVRSMSDYVYLCLIFVILAHGLDTTSVPYCSAPRTTLSLCCVPIGGFGEGREERHH